MSSDINRNQVAKSVSVINEVPPPPATCTVTTCTEESDVLFITVYKGDRKLTGYFIDFGHVKIFKTGEKFLVLNSGIIFKKWTSRCCGCYAREVQASGSSALQRNIINGKIKRGENE